MKVSETETLKRHKQLFAEAAAERDEWLPIWREINDNFYPTMFTSLYGTVSSQQNRSAKRNPKLLDGASANALLVLSAGFMNGVTSPARKWLRLKRPASQAYEDADAGMSLEHEEIRNKILEVLSGSNYYENRAMQVYSAAGFGTGALLCYEDREAVVKFVHCPIGSFVLITNEYNEVVGFGREFQMRLVDILAEFGEAALSADMLTRARSGKPESRQKYNVTHLIEENAQDGLLPSRTAFRELYWLSSPQPRAPAYLARRPMHEWPVAILRWSCPNGETFGVPPTLTCFGKAVQLQSLEYKSDQGLDKMVTPPLLADYSLKNRPKAFQAGGVTYTNNLQPNSGARPLLQVQMPFQELEIKRQRIVEGIEEALFNPLFNMISQLDTVRSATEVDARREEKLVMLGPVLMRSYSEDLTVLTRRVYGICLRKGLCEPPTESPEIEFTNILSDVQKASDVSTIERFFAFSGSVVPVFPEVQQKINAIDLLKQYAEGLGIRPTGLKPDDEAAAGIEQSTQMEQLSQVSEIAKNFGSAAGAAGKVDVGGGMNAVQASL